MSSVVISGNTSGAITLSAPDVSGTNTVTIPAATGTVMVSGNMPAFSAYKNSNQTGISSTVDTKVTFTVEEFDTNSCYDTSTSRFTPTVAGYYQVNAELDCYGLTGLAIPKIYKNGSNFKTGAGSNATCTEQYVAISALVYLNGTTDYIEIYAYLVGTSPAISNASGVYSYFQAYMARSA